MKKILVSVLLSILFPLTVFALTGEGTSGTDTLDTVDPEVIVTHPDGGEEFYVGQSKNITWSATDYELETDPIEIQFSANNGSDYSILDSIETNDGIYEWLIPAIISDQCFIKIIAEDFFGNIGADSSNAAFSLGYVPPAPPQNVNVDLSNGTDAVISWTEVDTTIYGDPIEINGYIVLYNETPYEDSLQCYYFLGYTDSATTNFTHPYVAQFRDQMYYRVIAYKDFNGRIRDILSGLSKPDIIFRKTNNDLAWVELRRRFK